MPLEYQISRCTRRCAVTGEPLEPGERYHSALVDDGSELRRIDVASSHWAGPPEGAVGWWQSALPDPTKKKRLAPNEVLLGLMEQWDSNPERTAMRYVLALLLVRRKLLRIEPPPVLVGGDQQESGPEQTQSLRLYCPSSDAHYDVQPTTPDEEQTAEIETQLLRLLDADAA